MELLSNAGKHENLENYLSGDMLWHLDQMPMLVTKLQLADMLGRKVPGILDLLSEMQIVYNLQSGGANAFASLMDSTIPSHLFLWLEQFPEESTRIVRLLSGSKDPIVQNQTLAFCMDWLEKGTSEQQWVAMELLSTSVKTQTVDPKWHPHVVRQLTRTDLDWEDVQRVMEIAHKLHISDASLLDAVLSTLFSEHMEGYDTNRQIASLTRILTRVTGLMCTALSPMSWIYRLTRQPVLSKLRIEHARWYHLSNADHEADHGADNGGSCDLCVDRFDAIHGYLLRHFVCPMMKNDAKVFSRDHAKREWLPLFPTLVHLITTPPTYGVRNPLTLASAAELLFQMTEWDPLTKIPQKVVDHLFQWIGSIGKSSLLYAVLPKVIVREIPTPKRSRCVQCEAFISFPQSSAFCNESHWTCWKCLRYAVRHKHAKPFACKQCDQPLSIQGTIEQIYAESYKKEDLTGWLQRFSDAKQITST